jgi:hypothetical protein
MLSSMVMLFFMNLETKRGNNGQGWILDQMILKQELEMEDEKIPQQV